MRLRNSLLVIVACGIFVVGQQAFAVMPCGSLSATALGGMSNLRNPSSLDTYNNPALAPITRFSVEADIARLYDMSEFETFGAAAGYRVRSFAFGAALTQLRNTEYYSEGCALLTVSASPLTRLRVGASLASYRLDFGEGYASLSAFSLSLGTVLRISESAILSLAARNVNRPRFDKRDDPFPIQSDLSLQYSATPSISFLIGHHLDSSMPDRFSVGQLSSISKNLDLMLGLQTEPLEISGGISLKLGVFSFEYAYRNNVYLDGTHCAGLRYTR